MIIKSIKKFSQIIRKNMFIQTILLSALFVLILNKNTNAQKPQPVSYKKIAGVKPRNIIYILSDDHRYDFMGFTGKVPGLQTPNMDRLANEGAHMENAFVTTSLCSPSRASILTGQYAHTHTVVDNQSPAPDNLIYFPQYLQKAGYQTAFLGKLSSVFKIMPVALSSSRIASPLGPMPLLPTNRWLGTRGT